MPKQVDHDARRAQLAEAAIAAIDAKGLDAVRLRDVAAAANLTTGAVVHYLPSKDAVLAAALEEVAARTLARVAATRGAPLIDNALSYLPLDAASMRDTRVQFQFWGRAVDNPALRAIHQRWYDALRAGVADEITPHLPRKEADAVADAIIAAVDGIALRAVLEPGAWDEARCRRTLKILIGHLAEDKAEAEAGAGAESGAGGNAPPAAAPSTPDEETA